MKTVTRTCVRTALIAGALACLAAASSRNLAQQTGAGTGGIGVTGSTGAGLPGENINDVLNAHLTSDTDATIEIAPMTKKGKSAEPAKGDYTVVSRKKVFDGIFSRAGIDPCTAEPADLKGHTGYLEYIKKSSVLNPGGTRATFGYFIKVTFKSGQSIEYFALFSYDKIKITGKDGAEETICATEFFLFGGFQYKDGVIQPNPPELEYGLAINKDGILIKEVPPELAHVSNFQKEGHENETVKPGVEEAEEGKPPTGCLICHARTEDDEPESTIPFPWVADPKAKPNTPPSTGEPPKTQPGTPGAGANTPAKEGSGGSATSKPSETTPPPKTTTPNSAPTPKNGESSLPSMTPATAAAIQGFVFPKNISTGEVSGLGVTDPGQYASIPGLQVVPVTATSSASETGEFIDLGDGRKQSADGPVTTDVPAQATSIPVRVFAANRPDQPITESSIPVEGSAKPASTAPPAPSDCTMPPIANAGSVEVIHVANGGNSEDSTQMSVAVDDAPATIVAAKPGAVFWNVSSTLAPGLHRVRFVPERGATPIELMIYVVTLQMSADNTSLIREQATTMHVVISGLENMPASLWRSAMPPADLVDVASIEQRAKGFHPPKPQQAGTVLLLLENHSPSQIKMGKAGDRIVLELHQKDFASGPYTYQDELQSLNTGGFNIVGTVVAFLEDAPGSE
ncbi:MAG: hypothetical protein ABSA32_00360 [Candidatus Acidiferrales bacterium]|jgi:hypothetical protein